ncbi:MAG: hypothetical protein EBT15_06885 [Betaproteobacteria bacterium]|nr:hypothetical protein [Betaproteobacteria bacterium]
MADLPIIQPGRVENAGIPGATLPQVTPPQVDYVGLRAGAANAQTVAQTLDRLSGQLFGIAKTAALEAGYQYVADNPVTPEQLEAAKRGNLEPLRLGGSLNIYDQAVRKARALELSGNFEAEARNKLTVMLTAVEQGQTTTEQVQQGIDAMMNGFSKSLAGVDPEASLKFRATIATAGNTVLAKAAEAEIKRRRQEQVIKFDRDFDNSIRLLEAAVSQGFWIDPRTGDKRSVDEFGDMYRQTISTSALVLGDAALQKQYSDKFEAAFKQAKIGATTAFVVSDEFSKDPEAGLAKLRYGDAGKMTDVFRAMPYDDKAKVIANYMVAMNERSTLAERKRSDDKRKDLLEFVPLYERAISLPENSRERKQLTQQIGVIAQRNPEAVPLSVIKDLNEPSKEGNQLAEFNVLRGIYEGTITSPDQIYSNTALNARQKVGLLKTLTTEDRRDLRELDSGLARLAGIPVIPGSPVVIDPKGVEFQRLQGLRADAQQIQAEATRDGKVITPRQTLLELEKRLEQRRNSEQAKAARNSLETVWEKKPWINGPITRETLPALKKKAGDDVNKQREIKQIERLLDQAEGNQ